MSKKPFVTKEQVEEIVKTYPTPFHLYDEKGIRENAKALKEAFAWNPGYKEYFAVKATPNPFLLQILKEYGCGCDCSSYTELLMSDAVGIDGIVLTKLDGDTRGGAALSVKKVTGRPIKYIATGEKMNDIEQFHPDRMASRILGMGDVLSIIEKAEEAITEEEAEKLEAQLRKNRFDMDDYLAQLRQIKKMGSFSSILKMIPGLGSKMKDIQVDDKEFLRIESMICSMTKEERRNPKILNGQRRLRIAKGSGTTVEQLNKFMKSFEMTQKMMKQMKSEKGMKNVMRNLKGIDKDAFKDLKF